MVNGYCFYYPESGTLLSLQMVKQTLRRLRWHHHHARERTSVGNTETDNMAAELCTFLKGEKAMFKSRHTALPLVSYKAILSAMMLQDKRAEV